MLNSDKIPVRGTSKETKSSLVDISLGTTIVSPGSSLSVLKKDPLSRTTVPSLFMTYKDFFKAYCFSPPALSIYSSIDNSLSYKRVIDLKLLL